MMGDSFSSDLTCANPGVRRGIYDGEAVLFAVTPAGMFPMRITLADALAGGVSYLHREFDAACESSPVIADVTLLPTVDVQEVWASGLTYEPSREARVAESSSKDVYDLVYTAARPELFFKAPAWRVPPADAPLRIRGDSEWDVPEPELGLVFTAAGELAGYVVGNDMSSRSIEGENPLYLPQAKLFDDSVGLSDTIVLARSCPRGDAMSITLTIRRQGAVVFADSTSTVHMRRSFTELRDYLFRELSFPHGVVLLTGTGIVPPVGFSLLPDDEVDISISGVGRLQHGIYRRPSNSVSMKVRDPESGSRSSESH